MNWVLILNRSHRVLTRHESTANISAKHHARVMIQMQERQMRITLPQHKENLKTRANNFLNILCKFYYYWVSLPYPINQIFSARNRGSSALAQGCPRVCPNNWRFGSWSSSLVGSRMSRSPAINRHNYGLLSLTLTLNLAN